MMRLIGIFSLLLAFACVAQVPIGPRRLNPLNDGIAWAYKLNEASGVAFDSIGTNHLTAVNTPGTDSGKVGTSRTFTSAGSKYFSGPQSPAFDFGWGVFTVACWVYPSNWNNSEWGLLSRRNDSNPFVKDEWSLYTRHSNAFIGILSNATAVSSKLATNLLKTNSWNLIIAWRAPGAELGLRTYSEFTPVGVTEVAADAGRIATNCPTFQIGTERASTFGNGRIDGAIGWKRLLTTNEMDFLWNLGHGGWENYVTGNKAN